MPARLPTLKRAAALRQVRSAHPTGSSKTAQLLLLCDSSTAQVIDMRVSQRTLSPLRCRRLAY